MYEPSNNNNKLTRTSMRLINYVKQYSPINLKYVVTSKLELCSNAEFIMLYANLEFQHLIGGQL